MKALVEDPWKQISSRFAIGQAVEGKILKVNPFGLFVELDPEIHGLAHISELIITPGVPVEQQIKSGQTRTFQIVSIEPDHHRLGLSEKALGKGGEADGEAPAQDTPATEVSMPEDVPVA